MLFGGNLLRQPALVQLVSENQSAIRVINDLKGSDEIMNSAIFLGTYPGLTKSMIEYEIEIIRSLCS
jgi:CDP-6-deoxy-D-xylo-4-hexulose-3-dehydrase